MDSINKMYHSQLEVGPLRCNCHLLVCPNTGDALLVDPGDEANKILSQIEKASKALGKPIQLKYLLHTHGHFDHIGGSRGVCGVHTHSKRALHKGDVFLYEHLPDQGRRYGMQFEETLPVNHFLEDREELKIGDLKLSVLHIPGHSPGSVAFRLHEDSRLGVQETLFTGDTLFFEEVGRTDLWGGSEDQMNTSIRKRIYTLDGDTRVHPGHGPSTSIKHEMFNNPWVKRD